MRRSARIVGYVRPHFSRPAGAQADAIREAARTHSWRIVEIVYEDASTGSRLDRPGLRRALEVVAGGEAHGLVVSSLDRLTPSLSDFGVLMRWFGEARRDLVSLHNLEFDTSTDDGRRIAEGLAWFAEWERDRVADRIRENLWARRRQGLPVSRPAVADQPELLALIKRLHADGHTLQEIADGLNGAGVPTLRGGKQWRPSSIQAAVGYGRPRWNRKPPPLPPPRPSE